MKPSVFHDTLLAPTRFRPHCTSYTNSHFCVIEVLLLFITFIHLTVNYFSIVQWRYMSMEMTQLRVERGRNLKLEIISRFGAAIEALG